MKGPYHDYMPEWYTDVGLKICQAMVINSVMPYVGVATSIIVPMLIQKLDNGFTDDIYKTKQSSLIKYRALYSGKDYEIHFKYSDAIVVVYVTMMYGLGMPILFPIAAFTLFNQWLCERIVVAWSVKLPPAMDDTLSNNAIKLLKFSPLFLLFNGYWMLSNK